MKYLLPILFLSSVANAQTYYNKTTIPPLPPQSPILYATSWGSCTWDATHDVGACINAAIAKAAAVGGGTIMIPCGTYGLSTQVVQQASGVKLRGCGNGIPRDTADSSKFLSSTRLLWIGGVTANPALVVKTASGGGTITTSADVVGITVDCNNICGKAIQVSGVSFSTFNIGGAEATSVNIEFTTPTDLEASGNQHNDIWAFSRSTSGSNSPTGILFDAGCFSCFNTSYNVIHQLFAWYNKGDGIVFGDSDNNQVELTRTFPQPGATGNSMVCANSAYTPPNGVAVKAQCRALRVLHVGGTSFRVTGYQTNSTFTAGSNAGSAALNPLTIATSGSAALATQILTFVSTSGAAAGETISCGGPVNGVFNGTPVNAVTSTTISIAPAAFITTVPGSTSCTLTYGILAAAAKGTYTLTATSSTLYTLTAPTGGHTQSGISASGGFLTFTDMKIPWTGTPATNDTWTIVVPSPPTQVNLEDVDEDNSTPCPTYEYGARGYYTLSTLGFPTLVQSQCVVGSLGGPNGFAGLATGANACTVGGQSSNASGLASVVLGGSTDIASGSYSSSIGGTGNISSGFGASTIGQNNVASGPDSFVNGFDGNDRGRFVENCWGGGQFAVSGDAQTCTGLLIGTVAGSSALRLTSNGAAVSTINCINIPNNTAYSLNIDIVAFDHTTVTKNNSWNNLTGLLTRGASAAATALAVLSAAPAVNYSNGAANGTMSITADTTNGCLNISWTPPGGNTDTWNVVARVRTVEVQ